VVSQGKYGNTPLHWAAVGGRVPCVEMLLKHGANKTVCNHNGRSPRDLAAAKGQTAVEHLLGDAYWSSDVRALHSSLERRVQEALDELRLGTCLRVAVRHCSFIECEMSVRTWTVRTHAVARC
jgi:hypothetical protein